MNNLPYISLSTSPILREALFYCIALIIFLTSFQDGIVTVAEAGLLVSIYFIYIGLVIYSHLRKGNRDNGDNGDGDSSGDVSVMGIGIGVVGIESDTDTLGLRSGLISGLQSESELDINAEGIYGKLPEENQHLLSETNTTNTNTTTTNTNGISKYSNNRDDMEVDVDVAAGNSISNHTSISTSTIKDIDISIDIDSNSGSMVCCTNTPDYCTWLITTIQTTIAPLTLTTGPFMEQVCLSVGKMHGVLDRLIGLPIQNTLKFIIPVLHTDHENTIVTGNGNGNGNGTGNTSNIAGNSTTGDSVCVNNSTPTLPSIHMNIHKDVSLMRVLVIFSVCIGLIGVFSSCIIVICTAITSAIGISNGTIGATLVSLGSEVCIYIWDEECICVY